LGKSRKGGFVKNGDELPTASQNEDFGRLNKALRAMWETTFPRNSHAGLGKGLYEDVSYS